MQKLLVIVYLTQASDGRNNGESSIYLLLKTSIIKIKVFYWHRHLFIYFITIGNKLRRQLKNLRQIRGGERFQELFKITYLIFNYINVYFIINYYVK